MAAEWTDRTIRGPAAEFLDPTEFRKLFGVSAEWLDERLADGSIPPPIRVSPKVVLFTWEHAVYVALWLKLAGVRPAAGKKNGPE